MNERMYVKWKQQRNNPRYTGICACVPSCNGREARAKTKKTSASVRCIALVRFRASYPKYIWYGVWLCFVLVRQWIENVFLMEQSSMQLQLQLQRSNFHSTPKKKRDNAYRAKRKINNNDANNGTHTQPKQGAQDHVHEYGIIMNVSAHTHTSQHKHGHNNGARCSIENTHTCVWKHPSIAHQRNRLRHIGVTSSPVKQQWVAESSYRALLNDTLCCGSQHTS